MHIREGGFRKIQKVHFVQLARAVNGVQVCVKGHRAAGRSHGLNQAAETARQGHLDHSTLSIPTVPSFMTSIVHHCDYTFVHNDDLVFFKRACKLLKILATVNGHAGSLAHRGMGG